MSKLLRFPGGETAPVVEHTTAEGRKAVCDVLSEILVGVDKGEITNLCVVHNGPEAFGAYFVSSGNGFDRLGMLGALSRATHRIHQDLDEVAE